MTGKEIVMALIASLRELLPGCAVRPAFSGRMHRKPETPQIAVEIAEERRVPGGDASAKLAVTLYTPAQETAADLLTAVCTALEGIPCPVQSVTRSEMRYDAALGCTSVRCVIAVGSASGGESGSTRVIVDGKPVTAAGAKVSVSSKTNRYGSVGETEPHTVTAGETTYTVTLSGPDVAAALIGREQFFLTLRGMRYGPCTVKTWEDDRVTVVAAGGEPDGDE